MLDDNQKNGMTFFCEIVYSLENVGSFSNFLQVCMLRGCWVVEMFLSIKLAKYEICAKLLKNHNSL